MRLGLAALLILLAGSFAPTASADHDSFCFGLVDVANGSVQCWRESPTSCHARIANETAGPVADESFACGGHLCREANTNGLRVTCEDRPLTGGRHHYATHVRYRFEGTGPVPRFVITYDCERTDGPGDHAATGEPCRFNYTRWSAGPGPETVAFASPSNRYPFLLP